MMTCVPFQAETTVYVIVRCKLDERVTTEAEFSPEDSPSIRVEGKLENEYTVSVKAPGKLPQVPPEVRHHAREGPPLVSFPCLSIQQLSKVSAKVWIWLSCSA